MEIKATDLRIGNLINKDNVIIEITRDKVSCLFRGKYYNTFESDEISGIPLTEELLLKMGAKWDIMHKGSMKMNGFPFYLTRLKDAWVIYVNSYDDIDICVCNYLHEFQNAYYVLMRQELTLS
jgi:hypothetical protein